METKFKTAEIDHESKKQPRLGMVSHDTETKKVI